MASVSTSVETIIDDTTSEPLLYIINWADDGGFVVVSASKKCFPVACYSETGNFSLDADPASKSYLEGYKSLVRDALNDTSDSLRARYALEWSVFEKSGPAIDANVYGEFFYMNLGWKGKCNGWYRSNAYIDDDGHSYLENQKIILIEEGD